MWQLTKHTRRLRHRGCMRCWCFGTRFCHCSSRSELSVLIGCTTLVAICRTQRSLRKYRIQPDPVLWLMLSLAVMALQQPMRNVLKSSNCFTSSLEIEGHFPDVSGNTDLKQKGCQTFHPVSYVPLHTRAKMASSCSCEQSHEESQLWTVPGIKYLLLITSVWRDPRIKTVYKRNIFQRVTTKLGNW